MENHFQIIWLQLINFKPKSDVLANFFYPVIFFFVKSSKFWKKACGSIKATVAIVDTWLEYNF